MYKSLQWTAIDVALMAIERVAASGCCHEDIDWRHVALCPYIDVEGEMGLEPILIDLVHVQTTMDSDDALENMTSRLREMIDDLQMYDIYINI